MSSRRALQCVVVAAASAAAIAGCGGDPKPDSSSVDERALALTGHPIVLPRDVVAQTAAQERLTQRCMVSHGSEYPPATISELQAEQSRQVQPYGFSSRENVAKAVRGDARLQKEGASILAKDRYKRSLSAPARVAYLTALNGDPQAPLDTVKMPDGSTMQVGTHGCQGTALKELYGDVLGWKRLEGNAAFIRIKTVDQTVNDPAFKRVRNAWVTCAKGRGLVAENPFRAAATGQKKSVRAQSALIETIWDCQQSTRMVDTGLRLEVRYAREASTDHERDLLAYRELARRGTQRAERVLAGDS